MSLRRSALLRLFLEEVLAPHTPLQCSLISLRHFPSRIRHMFSFSIFLKFAVTPSSGQNKTRSPIQLKLIWRQPSRRITQWVVRLRTFRTALVLACMCVGECVLQRVAVCWVNYPHSQVGQILMDCVLFLLLYKIFWTFHKHKLQ